jgi:hypothetical protein
MVILGNTITQEQNGQLNLTKRINELFPLVDFTDLTAKYSNVSDVNGNM